MKMGNEAPVKGQIVGFVMPSGDVFDAEVLYGWEMIAGYMTPGANLRVDIPADVAAQYDEMGVATICAVHHGRTREHLYHDGHVWCAAVPLDPDKANGTWHYKS